MKRTTIKKRKVGKGFKIFATILNIFSLLLIGMIIYLNVLNAKLLTLVTGVILIIDLFTCFLLLKSKKKKIGLLISTILILLYSFISYYLYKTTDFLSSLNLDYKTYNYSVVVLKESEYDKLKDIANEELGYYKDDNEQTTKSLEKITSKIEININDYDNTHDLAVDLTNNKLDAIIIEDSYLEVIEINGTPLDALVKKIYSYKIRIKTGDMSKDLNVTKKPFNIYVTGIDTYGEITSVSRSDVNMVVSVNPTTRQILLTSIPRDYYVRLHGRTGYPDKLTHAGMYGTDMSIKTIEDLLNIEINYYVTVNFTSVIDIVEAIDGVNVYSDYTFISMDNYKYQEGYNKVNGEQALSFARERKAFLAGDRQRIKNQQHLLEAIFEKCTSKSIITKYTKLLDTLSNSFITNMKMSRLTSLVRMQLTNNYSWTIISNSLNGTDSSNYTYSAPNTKAYVMEPLEESVEYASELINNMMKDITLSEEEVSKNQSIINGLAVSKTNANKNNNPTINKQEEVKEVQKVEDEGLIARLIKSNIEITEGDEYIYNGVTATYNKIDITNDDDLSVTFKVGDKTIDTYPELILYISKLDSGNYDIIHIVTYKGETITLTQSLTINELIIDDTPNTNIPSTEEQEDIPEENLEQNTQEE